MDIKNYFSPHDVISPKDKLKDLNVIYDGGEDEIAIAKFTWDGIETMGMRWNGFDGSKGNPLSTGHPTWFVVPHFLKYAILDFVEEQKDKKNNSNES